MLEGATNSNDLFNLFDVRVAMVGVVTHSSDGSKEGLIGGDVVSEWDGVSGSSKRWWCLNSGIRTWNFWCGWRYVFLVGIIEFARSGLVGVWETDAGNVGGSVFTDSEEPCKALLDSGVLLRCHDTMDRGLTRLESS